MTRSLITALFLVLVCFGQVKINAESHYGESNMALERTLSIVKPDAVAKNHIGQIVARLEKAGLQVVAARMMHLSKQEAEQFYAVHRERPFSVVSSPS